MNKARLSLFNPIILYTALAVSKTPKTRDRDDNMNDDDISIEERAERVQLYIRAGGRIYRARGSPIA